MSKKSKKFTQQEKSWMLYDWANSVYATVIMAAIFPIFFKSVAGEMGDYWWGLGTSVAMLFVAVSAPFIGAAADFGGYKKKLFTAFLMLGLIFTFITMLTMNWHILLLGYIVSHIGFSLSVLIYDSFLPDVTTTENMDKVSSYGFALGYIGGSTIPFLICVALLALGDKIGIDQIMATKISILITVLWWGIFSIPFVKNVSQKHIIEKPSVGMLRGTVSAAVQTAKKIFSDKAMLFFILAYFFYTDGVGTVINMATIYGATLGLDSTGMILALLVMQLVAVPCSILFSTLSKRFGSLNMITAAVCIYIGICAFAFYMGYTLEEGIITTGTALKMFWFMAFLVGTVQGGIQAISRSHFGKLVPPESSGEYFGFFDIFGKFASVMGPFLYAMTRNITGRSSFAILSVASLFIIGLIILLASRGRFAAAGHLKKSVE